MQKPKDLSTEYWNRLPQEHQALYLLVRPLPSAAYTADWHLRGLETMLQDTQADVIGAGGSFDLTPDYQRGHVWKQEQRVYFIESLIRRTAEAKVLFNCPGWTSASEEGGDIPEHTFQCIDGLQRLTTLRMFMANEIKVFGGYTAAQLKGTPFCPRNFRLQISIYQFNWRADLLQFYLDLNQGGTVHSVSELSRVQELLVEASEAKRIAMEYARIRASKD